MKWNILVIRGIKTKKYFVSTGEGMQKSRKIISWAKFILIFYEKTMSYETKEGDSPVL